MYSFFNQICRYSCHVNINNLWYSDRYYNTDWQFEMFKRGKDNGHATGFKCKLQNSFLISVTYVVGAHRGNSNLYLQHISFE